MTWTEARSGTSTATRELAHDDRAKDRRDENSRPARGPRARPRWLWPVIAGVLLVLVAGTGAVALVAARDEEAPPERRAGAEPSPADGGTESTPTPASAEPLTGDLTATGTVSSTSSLGTRWDFPMTLRLDCGASCRVTVLKAPGAYNNSAKAYVERVWTPSGGGAYRTRLDELLTSAGGFVSPGCEALRVKGSGTLTRTGDQVVVSVQHGRDQFPGPDGNQCTLVDRRFVFTGTLS